MKLHYAPVALLLYYLLHYLITENCTVFIIYPAAFKQLFPLWDQSIYLHVFKIIYNQCGSEPPNLKSLKL